MSTDDGTIAAMLTVSDELDAPVHEIRLYHVVHVETSLHAHFPLLT